MLTVLPPLTRDCRDCGAPSGMELQNTIHSAPIAVPLLYVCKRCGMQLTIPPPPLVFSTLGSKRDPA